MSTEFAFHCPLANGLHARPAAALAEAAGKWQADIVLTNQRTGRSADAKSVLELVAAGVHAGDPCLLMCSGAEAEPACLALSAFITERLPAMDEPLPAPPAMQAGRIPRQLAGVAATIRTGTPASPGIGLGQLVHAGALKLPVELAAQTAADPAQELEHAAGAFAAVEADLAARAAMAGKVGQEIARALAALVADPALRRLIRDAIEGRGGTAAQAIVAAVESFAAQLRASGSTYLRERVADLEDIGAQLLAKLPGGMERIPATTLTGPSILVASSLSATQLLDLDRRQLKGLVLAEAGLTSHVVILARSFGIPCVVGASIADLAGLECDAVVDGTHGFVAAPLTAEVRRYFDREQLLQQRIEQRAAVTREISATTRDGRHVEIAANISTAAEAKTAVERGADGVGLFRTEMLFSTAAAEPSEDEQYEVYAQAAAALDGRALIIRTLDVGGDKPLPYLKLPEEQNPFLGCRGIRVYQAQPELFARQLRAIIRASAHGDVWVMAPMVSNREEAVWFKEQVQAQQESLRQAGVGFNPAMPVGIMLEVPSAALIVDALCDVLDFFSVGTNDLTQYLLAAERGNPLLGAVYQEVHPALIRMLKSVVDQAHARQRWVGLCGELARDPRYTPLLVGLGFDELSMSVPAIPAVKSAVADVSYERCKELAEQALRCVDAAGILALLDGFDGESAQLPLTTLELIELHSDSLNKAEAIRELCGLHFLAGRCRDVDELEDAVWAREETYSTGLGFGIAIPHCKSPAVTAGGLALLRLAEPVAWGSLDGAPVDTVLMLIMPEGDHGRRHLQVFSALARKLMHEEFRAGLRSAADAARMLAFLGAELELEDTQGQAHD